MCGIFGFIGKSKNPKVTYDLAQSLFLKTEIRGTDATGFYALEPGDGQIILDKEPVKSSEYIKREIWTRDFADNADVDCFIGHCRQTSVGGGPEKVNRNNHPHWSDDRRVAMTHNGKIPEFSALKGRYDVESECDSEILLRMFESAQMIAKDREEELKKEFPTLTPFLAERLIGLKEIFSRVNYGAMAVAIAERGDDNQRYLWLFRDEERPLHVVDMRETLGQIFYCSTAEIWRNAVEATPSVKEFIPQDQVIIEFPAYQIWLLNLDPAEAVANEAGLLEQGTECWHIRKFKITKTKYIDWKETEDEDDKLSFKKPAADKARPPVTKIISRLGSNDVIVPSKVESNIVEYTDAEIVNSPPAPKEQGGKKKIDNGTSSGDTGVKKSAVSAQVRVNTGRSPGDESEYETNPPVSLALRRTSPTASNVLRNASVLNDISDFGETFEGEIDLDAFDALINEIETKFGNLKTEVHNKAKEDSLVGRDFSQILDNLANVRAEILTAISVLKSH